MPKATIRSMKKTVAVIFGGRSAEHDISIVTAIGSVLKPLELSQQYNVLPVYIAKDGSWYADMKLKDIQLFTTGGIEAFCAKTKKAQLLFDNGLVLIKSGLRAEKIKIDVVFPAMHGTFGEDGSLMGLLRMAHVPFVGCDMTASVIAMDKVLSKQVIMAASVPTPKFIHFSNSEFAAHQKAIFEQVEAARLHYPVFVKPAHLGSSIGITRVIKPDDLQNAIEVAMHYDDTVLVEEAVTSLIEVTVPIMGNDELTPALVEQPLTKAEDFLDFDTKYMQGGKKGGGKRGAQGYSKLPADIPESLYNKALEVAKNAYKAIGCTGIARIDLLIDSKANKVYFNEVNPMPGDLYAHNWRQAGIAPVQLVTRLVELAEARFARQQQLEVTLTTNFLKQF